MAIANMARLLSEAWDREIRETPDPFRHDNVFTGRFNAPMPTYRERLDEQPRNFYGDLIPRIVTVRRNLRRVKSW